MNSRLAQSRKAAALVEALAAKDKKIAELEFLAELEAICAGIISKRPTAGGAGDLPPEKTGDL